MVHAKEARRLNRDLGVNAAGIALVLNLLVERDEILRRLVSFEDV
ncbi:chaperone modulator CbpM [Leisingera daeponensis]|nr:chaperone modulator CbpM [Leisingera daeponensis]